MKKSNVLLAVGVLSGMLVGAVIALSATLSRPSPHAERVFTDNQNEARPAEQLSQIVESLAATLDEEIEERQLLGRQIEALQTEVRELRESISFADDPEIPAGMFDPQAMEDRFSEMGFTPQDRNSIRQLEAEARVRAIELDDIARREGWIGTQRFSEAMAALATHDNPVRAALGADGYDRYLYAAGRPNRLVVGTVMETSAAQAAGFRRNDVIVRYGGEPVYSNMQLVNLRSSGRAGEPVVVEIFREGQPMRLTLPRGPMGIGANAVSVNPLTNVWQGAE